METLKINPTRITRLVLSLLTAVLFMALPVYAQISYSTVTATITDPNGNLYAYATYSAQLVDTHGFAVSVANTPNGQPYSSTTPIAGKLSSAGVMTAQIPPNTILTAPSGLGTQWKITIGVPTESTIYTDRSPTAWNIVYTATISGNVDLSSQLSALAQPVNYMNVRTGQSTLVSASALPLAGGTLTGKLTFGATAANAIRWQSPTTATNTTYGGQPYSFASGIVNYSGVNDNTFSWGYNTGPACAAITPAQAELCDQMEMDYNDGTHHMIEQHWNFFYPNGDAFRTLYIGRALDDETKGFAQVNIGSTSDSDISSSFSVATGKFGSTREVWGVGPSTSGATGDNQHVLFDPAGTYATTWALLTTGQIQLGQYPSFATRPTDIYISTDQQGSVGAPAIDITQSAVLVPGGVMTVGTSGAPANIVMTGNSGSGADGLLDFGASFGVSPAILIFHSGSNQHGMGVVSGASEYFAGTSAGFTWNTGGYQTTPTNNQLMALSSAGVLTIHGGTNPVLRCATAGTILPAGSLPSLRRHVEPLPPQISPSRKEKS